MPHSFARGCTHKCRMKTWSISWRSATWVSHQWKKRSNLTLYFSPGEGKAFKAFEILKDCQTAKNRYKFALTCIKLNKYKDAELALTGAKLLQNARNQNYLIGDHHLNLNENRFIPNGASGYYLLGFVLEKQFKKKIAIDCYEKALDMQPTLWCAFERLCKMVAGSYSQNKFDASKIFQDNNADMHQMNSMIREHMINIQ